MSSKFLSDFALEEECDYEAVDRDRLDQNHAKDEVDEHAACCARVTCDTSGRVTGREALTDATAETGKADRKASTETGAGAVDMRRQLQKQPREVQRRRRPKRGY